MPPNVQAQYAVSAARAGKALLLEKPLGVDLAQAQALADAVLEAGVVSQMMFTNRYSDRVRTFLAALSSKTPIGATAAFLSGVCLPGGQFATPWRVEKGALLDVGPHMLDLLDAAMGPITDVQASGDPRRWIAITARHAGGGVSQAALSENTPIDGQVAGVRVFTEQGDVEVDLAGANDSPETAPTIRAEFAAAVKAGRPHELDVRRGVYLQRLLEQAADSLAK